jgi:DEAD/DEAH box helicase domain-containing protein
VSEAPVFALSMVEDAARDAGFDIVSRATLPAREPRYHPCAKELHPKVKSYAEHKFSKGLFLHQAASIESFLAGNDICLSTSTASGKTLVFQLAAAHLLLSNQQRRVLALYPARALIQDQSEKWERMAAALGFTVATIDGSTPTDSRLSILRSAQVLLMTPDVAHAWLMSNLREPLIREFLAALCLLVLDEAHVYEGVFGTNMAYFLRRFQAVAARHQIICSTATLGEPANFVNTLIGRTPETFGPDLDRSGVPQKTVLLAEGSGKKQFDAIVALLRKLVATEGGRFLAFADSRRMVEQVVAAVHRSPEKNEPSENEADEDLLPDDSPTYQEGNHKILPYRAGYETEDRREIQTALSAGRLAGVVSTSAMELGLDIGEIDLIILLAVPATAKEFWQRIGRGGRRHPGICLMIDSRAALATTSGGLQQFLKRPLETSHLYLDNRYLQYANAVCAAAELQATGNASVPKEPFRDLPQLFLHYLENEVNPKELVPPDLYQLKQRAQAGPHREFPLRSGIETEFTVLGHGGLRLGKLNFAQALREAYPGAIYYYMAKAYRVVRLSYRRGDIHARRERAWTTRPISQTMVFPKFPGPLLTLRRAGAAFLAEAEMQVSERVLGFHERHGAAKPFEHRYGVTSTYSQRELNRFFQTTGVCWSFPGKRALSESALALLVRGFCSTFGVQERDVGCGYFYSKCSPFKPEACQGACIFDGTQGSLRLTQRLAEHFDDAVAAALRLADNEECDEELRQLQDLELDAEDLKEEPTTEGIISVEAIGEWTTVIAPGEQAVYVTGDGTRDVQVIGYRYTPQGLVYELRSDTAGAKWIVAERTMQPIHGQTRTILVNLTTGEEKPA